MSCNKKYGEITLISIGCILHETPCVLCNCAKAFFQNCIKKASILTNPMLKTHYVPFHLLPLSEHYVKMSPVSFTADIRKCMGTLCKFLVEHLHVYTLSVHKNCNKLYVAQILIN